MDAHCAVGTAKFQIHCAYVLLEQLMTLNTVDQGRGKQIWSVKELSNVVRFKKSEYFKKWVGLIVGCHYRFSTNHLAATSKFMSLMATT